MAKFERNMSLKPENLVKKQKKIVRGPIDVKLMINRMRELSSVLDSKEESILSTNPAALEASFSSGDGKYCPATVRTLSTGRQAALKNA